MKNYDDIINLPYNKSKRHNWMSMDARAGQFSPFAALTGYSDSVSETGRIVGNRIELDEEEKVILNRKLNIIKSNIKNKPEVMITYFLPDERKEGGEYITVLGNVKKIDDFNISLQLTIGTKILINDILDIDLETKKE